MGSLVGSYDESIALVEKFDLKVAKIKETTDQWLKKPRIYFEEWDDPIISGIAWVSELIELAGGEDIFKNQSQNSLAKDRIVSNPKTIIELQPDIILVSWCGKKLKKDKITSREGWGKINAIKNDYVFEIKSEIILQPGPASLFDGLDILHKTFVKYKS
jgi:iron complex transport system substrate-binding protein